MKLWKPSVSDRIGSSGIQVWFFDGHRVEIDGEEMVRSGNALFPLDDSWFPSRDEARANASERLRELAGVLMAQSYRLTQEEDHATA